MHRQRKLQKHPNKGEKLETAACVRQKIVQIQQHLTDVSQKSAVQLRNSVDLYVYHINEITTTLQSPWNWIQLVWGDYPIDLYEGGVSDALLSGTALLCSESLLALR